MSQSQLFKNIFGREESAPDDYAFLKDLTEQHPYFGAAHFYLFKNSSPGSPDFKENAAKTALFFNDLFLLNAQLQETIVPLPAQTEPLAPIVTGTEKNDSKKEVKEELLFEPLHSTDYFASQGIKLSEAVADSDKLGKQLKSFTAWLKTMKKVHPERAKGEDATVDTAVRNLAEKSNTEEDVITEAMAEAYILQNKREKALELYTKLSLLNPSKSAYFAAKIDTLKT